MILAWIFLERKNALTDILEQLTKLEYAREIRKKYQC